MKTLSSSLLRVSHHVGRVALLLFALGRRANAAGPAAKVVEEGGLLRVAWPISEVEGGSAALSLDEAKPLIESLGVAARGEAGEAIATGVNPVTLLTVGSRDMTSPAGWVAFFDNPPKRPHETSPVVPGRRRARVTHEGARTTLSVAEASARAGSFRGDLRFTFYRNSPLIQAEAVLSTREDGRAIVYDAGLTRADPGWRSLAWNDTGGTLRRVEADRAAPSTPVAVAGRTIVAEG